MVLANLVLHHFSEPELRHIGQALNATRVLLAREPARCRAWMRYGLYPLRLHPVTRHDMLVSIRAGFLGPELITYLALQAEQWRTEVRITTFNAYALEAVQHRRNA